MYFAFFALGALGGTMLTGGKKGGSLKKFCRAKTHPSRKPLLTW
jgi:hypothetical protein